MASQTQTSITKEPQEKMMSPGNLGQLVECLTLDFGSSHDLLVHEIKLSVGLCVDNMEPAWDSLCHPLSAPSQFALSLSQNKNTLNNDRDNMSHIVSILHVSPLSNSEILIKTWNKIRILMSILI